MAQNEFSFSDYEIFNNAKGTVLILKDLLNDQNSIVTKNNNDLNDAIFMGPICDSCKSGMSSSISKFSNNISKYETFSKYFNDTYNEYKKGDNEAKVQVLSSEDGELKVTSLASVTRNGKTIYYNQKGYIGDDGQLHQWPTTWGKNIASSGCGPTSMATCLANMLNDPSITPTTIANMMNYDDNIGGSYVAKVANRYGLDQTCDIGLNKEYMDNFLDNNGTMIVAVNSGGHYIAVLGRNSDGTYDVCDPNDWNTSTKRWTYDDISTGHTMVFHIAPKGKTVQECIRAKTYQV